MFGKNSFIKNENGDDIPKIIFKKLTPIDYADISVYEEALDLVFQEKDLLNIAITGSYSAGKSSVLETYKKKHMDKNFIHISLADFALTDNLMDSENISNTNLLNRKMNLDQSTDTILEGKIINQLMHQIKTTKIPQTHFKIKRNNSLRKLIGISLFVMIMLASFLFTLFPNIWYNFLLRLHESEVKNLLLHTQEPVFIIAIGIIFILLTGIGIFSIVKFQMDKSILKKIAVKGMEIEVLEDNKDSYFDKYLNEVLYIFENSKADGIVFEDIDRYDNNRIFTKLREINYLVNRKLENRRVRFFYLLRDDIFVSKDRTKFFDLILPIIPIVDSSNALDIFIEHFEEAGILEEFDKYFLQGIALYIDDMRLLKNICNEYSVYSNKIKNIELNKNKLLSIMVLKNVFPNEFSCLQLGRGYLSSIFANKDKLIDVQIKKLKMEIEYINKKINDIEKESLSEIVELNAIFIEPDSNKYFKHSGNRAFSNRLDMIAHLSEHPEEFFLYIKNEFYSGSHGNAVSILNTIKNDENYQNRMKLILSKKDGTLNDLAREKKNIENSILDVNRKKLHELLSKENLDEFISSQELIDKYMYLIKGEYFPLIKYLIRNGYIDETYPDYMSYFYEKSIKRVDKVFIRSVLDETTKEYSYHIEEPQKVIESLNEGYFRKEDVLNNRIFDYLLDNWSRKSELLIDQLVNNKNLAFMWQFFMLTEKRSTFINQLFKYGPQMFDIFINDKNADSHDRDNFVLESIYTLSEENALSINKNGSISDYLSNTKNIYSKQELNNIVLISRMKLLNVKVSDIDLDSFNKEIVDEIYENSLYKLDIHNILLWLKQKYQISVIDKTKILSYILSDNTQSLKNYTLENIEDVVNHLIDSESDILNDEIDVIKDLLNNKNLDKELKVRYLDLQVNKIPTLSEIEDMTLWDSIISLNKVVSTFKNVIDYFVYKDKVLSSELIEFLNCTSNDVNILYSEIEVSFDKSTASSFFIASMLANELENTQYKKLLSGYKHYIESFSYSEIENDKLTILIDLKVLRVNKKTIEFIRLEYVSLLDYYVASNFIDYLSLVEEEEVNNNEVSCLLNSKYIKDEDKLKLLQLSDDPISISNYAISDKLTIYTLVNRFDTSDLSYFLEKWETFNSDVRMVIVDLVYKHMDIVITEMYNLKPKLVIEVLSNHKVTIESAHLLIILCLTYLSKDLAIELFRVANEDKFVSIFESKRPNIPRSDYSRQVLEYLEDKKWITSFGDSSEKEDCYKVYTKRKWFEES